MPSQTEFTPPKTEATVLPTTPSHEYNEVAVYEQEVGANIRHVQESWDNVALPFGEGRNIYTLCKALCGSLDSLDYRINVCHKNIHLPYAEGNALDRIALLANVQRKIGESDDHFRKRIIAHIISSISGTTFKDVVKLASLLLETSVDNVTFDKKQDTFPATLFVRVTEQDIRRTDFSAEEIADLLDMAVPADHNVILFLEGTFLFKAIGATDDPDHGFTSTPADESIGGTFAGQIGLFDEDDDFQYDTGVIEEIKGYEMLVVKKNERVIFATTLDHEGTLRQQGTVVHN